MTRPASITRLQTVIVGGGQAGLSMGYHLARLGLPFLILDAGARTGDSWRHRWDSLRLFTPARYAGLDGYPFPAPGDHFPTKDEMAGYLEDYAARFKLPVRHGVRVEKLCRCGDSYRLLAKDQVYEAENVVVAMGNYQVPDVPSFSPNLTHGIVQLHSAEDRNPSQLREGGVLVVGAGNSAADIALEVSKTHPAWISGKESGEVPVDIESPLGRFLAVRIVRFIGHHLLTLDTKIGRKHRPKLLRMPSPLIRVRMKDLVAAGVERVPHVVGVRHGRPLLRDNRVLDVNNVIWCTGFKTGFCSWIDLPVFDEDRAVRQERGVVPDVPGVYFVGLHFQYAMSSATLVGVGRDARYLARIVESRMRLAVPQARREFATA